jgi:hypothetical protein
MARIPQEESISFSSRQQELAYSCELFARKSAPRQHSGTDLLKTCSLVMEDRTNSSRTRNNGGVSWKRRQPALRHIESSHIKQANTKLGASCTDWYGDTVGGGVMHKRPCICYGTKHSYLNIDCMSYTVLDVRK